MIDCWTKGKGRFCKWSQAIKVATLLRTRLKGLWTAPSATLNGGSSIWTGNAKRLTHIKKGKEEQALESAKNLLDMNVLTPEQIAQAVGLPLEQVLELQKEAQASVTA